MTLAPTPDPDDVRALRKVVKVLLMAVGGGLGAFGGPLGAAAAAGAVEALGSAVDRLGARKHQQAMANAQVAMEVAGAKSGLNVAQLVDRVTATPGSCQLAVLALDTAADATDVNKMRLMGHVIANAATDAAVVDEEMLLTRAVRLLDAPHFRALALLENPPTFGPESGNPSTMRWTPVGLAVQLGWPQRSVTSVLLTLQGVAAAFVEPGVMDSGSSAGYRELLRSRQPHSLADMYCEITDFGAHLVQRLREAEVEG